MRRSSRARVTPLWTRHIIPYLKVIELSVSIPFLITFLIPIFPPVSKFCGCHILSFITSFLPGCNRRFYMTKGYGWIHTVTPWSLSLSKERFTTYYNLSGLCGLHRRYRELWEVDCGFETVFYTLNCRFRILEVEAFFGWLKLLDHPKEFMSINAHMFWNLWRILVWLVVSHLIHPWSNIKSWQLQN